ncbi:UvrD-helicase domain-containing protein [Sphingobacterium sp. BS-2]|uniref:UvrD-helicase domain-containing protein n=1 Tax=Sphingobacterium sp. BS-2 TaxID=3377129 RepID=UPI0038FC1AF3
MQSTFNNNKLIIAAAGSGKTTFLIDEALKQKEGNVLITTYTQANEAEIRKKIIEKNKCIPDNVTVQTWFSFLLKHGVRPFQGILFDKKIKGLILVNSLSGLKGYTKTKQPIYFGEEKEFEKHYFSKELKIYSDKLSKFVFRCNEKSNGSVIDRISRIYSHIFIDEIQDLAGYDLTLLKLLFNCSSNILLVGDPRQGTYSTNSAPKNKQFKKANVVNYFFQDKTINIETDQTSLMTNYRCNKPICDLSNKLFANFSVTTSGNYKETGHDGVFFIKEKDIESYLQKYKAIQLRNDSREKRIKENYSVMNFGESKGLSFDRVLIYPTKPFLDWIKDNSSELAETSRSKLYVALTRAKYSVAIVNDKENINNDISHYLLGE